MAEQLRASLELRRSNPLWSGGESLAPSIGLVVLFWWVATGLTIAMQRSEGSRLLTLVVTTAFAFAGAMLIAGSRNERSPRSARTAFFGASLLWWWSATLFYGGWGVSPDSLPAGPKGSLALAIQAIDATLAIDLITVGTIVLVGVLVWHKPNRVALWTLLAFWGTLQTAKLNVFFGVRNPGTELLPPALAGLRIFFGPAQNSPLLVVTIFGIALFALLATSRARLANSAFVRHGSTMLAMLLLLAAVEHVFLGLSTTLPLWNFFLRVRGQ